MQVVEFLHNFLKKSIPTIHLKVLNRLVQTASSLLTNGKLSLTSLGRHTSGSAFVKHKIKAVDRLLGNERLHQNRLYIYQALAFKVIGNMTKIDIIVDWSPAGNRENHMLRASVAFKDRSITIYEEVHPEKLLGNYGVHKSFLANLKKVLPSHVKPVLITDAGFRTEWFELVLVHGWDFEGRITNNMLYQIDNEDWNPIKSLFPKATIIPKYIGNILLTKANEFRCHAYLYHEKIKVKLKKRKMRRGKSPKNIKQYRAQTLQPWMLVTSLKHMSNNAKKVVRRYTRRMKIEHEFRDTKDRKWGVGLNDTHTRDPKRLEILLLIGTIAIMMLWLLGLAAEYKQLHYQFQANSVKKHRVLSLIFLGLQIVLHALDKIRHSDIQDVFRRVQENENNFYLAIKC